MIDENVRKRYENEIAYQKHMIENLHRWQTLFFLLSGVFIVLLYFFHQNTVALVFLIILTVLAVIAGLVFGQGIYNGRKNVNKIIDEYERVLKSGKASV